MTTRKTNQTLVETTYQLLREWSDGLLEGRIPLHVAPTDVLYRPEDKAQLVHPYPELFMVTRGIDRFRFPTGGLELRAGEMLLVPAGVPHAETFVDTDQPFHMLVIGLNHRRQAFIHATQQNKVKKANDRVFSAENPNARAQLSLLSAIEHYLKSDGTTRTGVRCMAMLLKEFMEQDLPTSSGWGNTPRTLAQKATQLAQVRFRHADCTVANIAERLEVSPNHLSAAYRRETGERLSDVILQQRLQHAKDLLDYSDHKIVDIAAYSGFTDPSPFIAHFKSRNGMTPLQYRKSRDTR